MIELDRGIDFLEQSERPKEHRCYDWIVLA
jgi:hypothetical protein